MQIVVKKLVLFFKYLINIIALYLLEHVSSIISNMDKHLVL